MNVIKHTIIILCSLIIMNIRGAEQKIKATRSQTRESERKVEGTPLQVLSPEEKYLNDIEQRCESVKRIFLVDMKEKAKQGDVAIIDIDDTALLTYLWKEGSSEKILPLPPVLDLYNFLIDNGVEPIFITAREQQLKEDPKMTREQLIDAGYKDPTRKITRKQLINAGYKGDFDINVMPPSFKKKPGLYKFNVRKEISEHARILFNIGDNDYDFEHFGTEPQIPGIGAMAFLEVQLPSPRKLKLNKNVLRSLIQAQMQKREQLALEERKSTTNVPGIPKPLPSLLPPPLSPDLRSSLVGSLAPTLIMQAP
jgi:predicted secreted acid phosphatase